MTDDDFIKLLENLQKKIENEEEETFSKVVISEYRNPSNFGVLEEFNAIGQIKGPCGDTMKITLEIKNGKILKVGFWTDGCGPTIACGSMLTKIIKGISIQDANKISRFQLLEALDGLPIEHHHCTVLATDTLKNAIKNYNNINFLDKKDEF